MEGSVILLNVELAWCPFKAYGFFLNGNLIKRSLLTAIIAALAVNGAKSCESPNNISGICRSTLLTVCVCMFHWEAGDVIISVVRRWVYSGRLYEVCRDSFVTEPAIVTAKCESSLNSCPYQNLNPLPHIDLIHLSEAWMPAV